MNKFFLKISILLFCISCNFKKNNESKDKIKSNKTIKDSNYVVNTNLIVKSDESPCNIIMEFISKDSLKVEMNGKILKGIYKKNTNTNNKFLFDFYVDNKLIFVFNNDPEEYYISNQDYSIPCEESNIIMLYK